MGLFSRLFRKSSPKVVSGRNPGSGWTFANRFNRTKGGVAGGYGAITFGNIMNAHCSPEDIVDEFGLDDEGSAYVHPHLGTTCYMYAYQQALMEVMAEAMMLGVDPEDLIDWDQVEEEAYEHACDLAQLYIDGATWIPSEILHWAYYDISDHNG